jgi:hypothetical protein
MSKYSEKDLARAKRVREHKLERLKAIVEACNCCWPVDTYRNQHGHSEGCPAIAVWQKLRDEREEARDDADY